jgi:Anti-sigma factor NepR
MSTNWREADEKRDVLVGIERDLTAANLKAVRTGIGLALRTLHSEVLREEVPERMAELLTQFDQQKDADSA